MKKTTIYQGDRIIMNSKDHKIIQLIWDKIIGKSIDGFLGVTQVEHQFFLEVVILKNFGVKPGILELYDGKKLKDSIKIIKTDNKIKIINQPF